MTDQIVNGQKQIVYVWAGTTLILSSLIIYILYSLITEISSWYRANRENKIKLKGRDNVNDAADDNYDPIPGEHYTVPSGRTVKYNAKKKAATKDVLTSTNDKYIDEPQEEDEEN